MFIATAEDVVRQGNVNVNGPVYCVTLDAMHRCPVQTNKFCGFFIKYF